MVYTYMQTDAYASFCSVFIIPPQVQSELLVNNLILQLHTIFNLLIIQWVWTRRIAPWLVVLSWWSNIPVYAYMYICTVYYSTTQLRNLLTKAVVCLENLNDYVRNNNKQIAVTTFMHKRKKSKHNNSQSEIESVLSLKQQQHADDI